MRDAERICENRDMSAERANQLAADAINAAKGNFPVPAREDAASTLPPDTVAAAVDHVLDLADEVREQRTMIEDLNSRAITPGRAAVIASDLRYDDTFVHQRIAALESGLTATQRRRLDMPQPYDDRAMHEAFQHLQGEISQLRQATPPRVAEQAQTIGALGLEIAQLRMGMASATAAAVAPDEGTPPRVREIASHQRRVANDIAATQNAVTSANEDLRELRAQVSQIAASTQRTEKVLSAMQVGLGGRIERMETSIGTLEALPALVRQHGASIAKNSEDLAALRSRPPASSGISPAELEQLRAQVQRQEFELQRGAPHSAEISSLRTQIANQERALAQAREEVRQVAAARQPPAQPAPAAVAEPREESSAEVLAKAMLRQQPFPNTRPAPRALSGHRPGHGR